MKALDTNILVRFLTGDDPAAFDRVATLLRSADERGETFMVTDPVLLELLWVLRSSYDLGREKILDAVDALLDAPVFTFQSTRHVRQFVAQGRVASTELDDLLIGLSAEQQGCESTLTLDKKAAQSDLFEEIA